MARAENSIPPHEVEAVGRIAARLPDLIDRMFELADGVRVVDDETGTLYTRPPERAAIEYLLNRVLGRPASASGPNAKPEIDRISLEGSVTIVLPDNGRDLLPSGARPGTHGGAVGNPSPARASDVVPHDAG
jgi:hypothetical protein